MQDAGKSMQAYRLKQQPFAPAASVSLHWKLSGFKDHLGWFCNHCTYHPYMDIDHVKLEDVRTCSSSLLDWNKKKAQHLTFWSHIGLWNSCSVWFVKHHLVHQNKSLHKNDSFMNHLILKFTSLTHWPKDCFTNNKSQNNGKIGIWLPVNRLCGLHDVFGTEK